MMRRIVIFCSVLCGLTAVIALFMGIRVLTGTGQGYFINVRVFRLAESGTIAGFIGNLVGTAISVVGFGAMALYGFINSQQSKKMAFVFGLIMTGVCLISVIGSIITKTFTIGYVYMLLLPAAYTYAVLKSA